MRTPQSFSSFEKEGLLKTAEKWTDVQLPAVALTEPFKKIALALSGGGFRAAAYSLGTMSYLQHIEYGDQDGKRIALLDNVEFVASASGGTFAGILYTMHVCQGINFDITYKTLLDFLQGQVLVENVLQRLNDEEEWKGEKSRNLINSFAGIYDQELFKGETLGVYSSQAALGISRNIEVCFNATEFYRGLSFRFQASNNSNFKGKIGNNYIYFNPWEDNVMDIARKIKLGDIMAASSCFPAGFEPMLFPADFSYSNSSGSGLSLSKDELLDSLTATDYDNEKIRLKENLGLMDGGINDNQGVYSTLGADSRRRLKNKEDGFDLILVTDVGSYFMDDYESPKVEDERPFRHRTINWIQNTPIKTFFPKVLSRLSRTAIIFSILMVLAIVASLSLSDVLFKSIAIGAATFFLLSSFILLLAKKYIFGKSMVKLLPGIFNKTEKEKVAELQRLIPSLTNFSGKTIQKLVGYLENSPIGIIEQMLRARAKSVLSLVVDVNLKQTRRLIFDIFYGKFHGEAVWQNRRAFNVIYELSIINLKSRYAVLENKFFKEYAYGENTGDNKWAKGNLELLTEGCDVLHPIAEEARTMGTTLWTDEADTKHERIKKVVSCAQFTTCAKLLEYCIIIERILDHQKEDPNFKKQIILTEYQESLFYSVKAQVQIDWMKFKEDPYFLFKIYK